MNPTRTRWTLVAACACLLHSAHALAPAQPERGAEPPTPEEAIDRLEGQLEALRDQERRVLEAIEQIENGASPQEVRDTLDPPQRRAGRGEFGRHRRDRRDEFGAPDRPGRGPFGGFESPGRGDVGPSKEDLERYSMDDVMEFLREQDPRMHERLSMFRERNPERFDRMMDERADRVRRMLYEKDQNPELFLIRKALMAKQRDIREIVRDAALEDSLEALYDNDALRVHVGDVMRLHGQLKRHEIGMLRERVEVLESQAEQESNAGDAEIDERIGEMIETARRFTDRPRRERNGSRPRGPRPDRASPPGDH